MNLGTSYRNRGNNKSICTDKLGTAAPMGGKVLQR